MLKKTEKLNELFSLYQSLLTEKQVDYFNMYYQLDYSLQEIADNYQVSRNAIFDQLKKVEEHLYNYENKLKLNELKNKRNDLLDKYIESKNLIYLEELRKLDE
ncbi:MAG TPA: hypothetical protein GX742_02735 [Acholeplasmataceae bacterium]|nr:hypothetical protein [Acholeplasmataceae bacterium]